MDDRYHYSRMPDGMSLDEIAKELNLTYNEVRNALNTGMIKLRLKAMANGLNKKDYLSD